MTGEVAVTWLGIGATGAATALGTLATRADGEGVEAVLVGPVGGERAAIGPMTCGMIGSGVIIGATLCGGSVRDTDAGGDVSRGIVGAIPCVSTLIAWDVIMPPGVTDRGMTTRGVLAGNRLMS